MTLKGAVSHRVALGTDARGNITRLDNALAGILERLERANEQLNNLYNQQEAAKAEVGKPFPQEAELTAKSQRLAELDAALNMEDSVENRDERSESERPSVLADLKSKAEHIPPAKYSETREEALYWQSEIRMFISLHPRRRSSESMRRWTSLASAAWEPICGKWLWMVTVSDWICRM